MRKQRIKRVVVRISTEEHEALTAKAAAAGVSLSELVRDHIDRVRIFNHADKEAWLRATTALSNSAAAMGKTAMTMNPVDSVVALAFLAAIHRRLASLNKEFPAHDCKVL